jgi:Mrp family chromosome partitioning ATPase
MTQIQDSMDSPKKQQRTKDDQDIAVENSLSKIKHKIMVMSGKGGVGKTSTSVNIAIALANKGFRVGLVDVDIHGPDVPRMLGITGQFDINENRKLLPKVCRDSLKVVSVESLMLNRDDAIIWRGPMKFSAIKQFLGDVEWGDLDFLIVDSPPGTGDEPLTIAQTIKDIQAVIVTTPQEVSLADVRKSINFCKTVNMKIFGLIENMSGFTCPHCGKSVDLFGAGGGEKTAKDMDVPFLGKIPFDQAMVSCGDAGVAYQDENKESDVTKAFADIAEKMATSISS